MNNRLLLLTSIFSILLTNCQQEKNSSIYILHTGRQFPYMRDVVIKSNEESFVDSIMEVGKPIELIVKSNEIKEFKEKLQNECTSIPVRDSGGFVLLTYHEKHVVDTCYIKSDTSVVNIIQNASTGFDLKTQERLVDWFLTIKEYRE